MKLFNTAAERAAFLSLLQQETPMEGEPPILNPAIAGGGIHPLAWLKLGDNSWQPIRREYGQDKRFEPGLWFVGKRDSLTIIPNLRPKNPGSSLHRTDLTGVDVRFDFPTYFFCPLTSLTDSEFDSVEICATGNWIKVWYKEPDSLWGTDFYSLKPVLVETIAYQQVAESGSPVLIDVSAKLPFEDYSETCLRAEARSLDSVNEIIERAETLCSGQHFILYSLWGDDRDGDTYPDDECTQAAIAAWMHKYQFDFYKIRFYEPELEPEDKGLTFLEQSDTAQLAGFVSDSLDTLKCEKGSDWLTKELQQGFDACEGNLMDFGLHIFEWLRRIQEESFPDWMLKMTATSWLIDWTQVGQVVDEMRQKLQSESNTLDVNELKSALELLGRGLDILTQRTNYQPAESKSIEERLCDRVRLSEPAADEWDETLRQALIWSAISKMAVTQYDKSRQRLAELAENRIAIGESSSHHLGEIRRDRRTDKILKDEEAFIQLVQSGQFPIPTLVRLAMPGGRITNAELVESALSPTQRTTLIETRHSHILKCSASDLLKDAVVELFKEQSQSCLI